MRASDVQNPSSEGTEIADSELVKRCQEGDNTAFDLLVAKYRTRVYAMTYQYTYNEQDAWDLAQDGFVKAWKSMKSFRGQSSFYTWLYRVVSNVAIDWKRKQHMKFVPEFDDTVSLQDIEPTNTLLPKPELAPHAKMEDGEIRGRIDEAMKQLSEDHRVVVYLKEMEGMQYHEIAESLGCSIGTVMSRLFYARRKLQSLLKDVYETL